jgi:predicted esterase YcpF (UPF0227 family)
MPKKPREYDDLLPVNLHRAKDGQYHLLDRHNDEIATFDRAVELEDMQRIVTAINATHFFEAFEKAVHAVAELGSKTLEDERIKSC